jgi:hypothetical protein
LVEVKIMRRSFVTYVVYAVITLGVVGFLYTILFEPGSLLRSIGTIFFFLIIFYLVYRFVLGRRQPSSSPYDRKYAQAVKQSKSRLREREKAKVKPKKRMVKNPKITPIQGKAKNLGQSFTKERKRSSSHLTVIEGKKGKKKNRALF